MIDFRWFEHPASARFASEVRYLNRQTLRFAGGCFNFEDPLLLTYELCDVWDRIVALIIPLTVLEPCGDKIVFT